MAANVTITASGYTMPYTSTEQSNSVAEKHNIAGEIVRLMAIEHARLRRPAPTAGASAVDVSGDRVAPAPPGYA